MLALPQVCPICAVPLVPATGKRTARSPSIDRLIPTLGYTSANTWIICSHCNVLKNGATPDLMRRVLAEIEQRGLVPPEAAQAA